MTRLRIGMALGLLFLPPLAGAAKGVDSSYSSVRAEDCHEVPDALAHSLAEQGVQGQECPGLAGWRLLFLNTDERSWLELRRDGARWSGADDPAYRKLTGPFANIGGSDVVEWRLDEAGEPRALIFRAAVPKADDPVRNDSVLFVVRLDQPQPCLAGRASSNEAARALADGPPTCLGEPAP
ncbi:hypothetical protein [Geminicoccus roseus]|uniref:hypothetical protein n=1 Tax=Geminicoccus roseus TaxID=404900 RepID=UPI0003F5E19F|nr:hypothetical protein [Geminicoccus roseus]